MMRPAMRVGPIDKVSLLWKAFALGWAVVFVLVLSRVYGQPLSAALLVVLAALYLHVTLRRAIEPEDLSPLGPSRSQLQERALLLTAMVALVVLLSSLLPHVGMWWLLQHAIIAAGLCLPARPAACMVVGLTLLSLLLSQLLRGRVDPLLLIQLSFGAGAMALRQMTRTVAELRAAREQVASLVVAEERKRFGRDLHDLLGHSLSLIAIKSELARQLLVRSPELARSEIVDIERTARDSLRRVRAAVAGYRQLTWASELNAAQQLLAAAGVAVRLDLSDDAPSDLDNLLAWTLREAVTNVVKHSGAKSCVIELEHSAAELKLRVCDDGRGASSSAHASGHGIAGLRERASEHRGELCVSSPDSGGFVLLLTVPSTGVNA